MKIVSIGEILWDVFPTGEHLGGAPFNFAVNAHRLGHQVLFVSAVGNDERGSRALARMQELGLATGFVKRVDHPTGTVSVAFRQGEPQYTIHRPAAYDFVEFDPRLVEFHPDWIYFGTLLHTPAIEDLLEAIPARRFYDVNLRPDSWTPSLVRTLLAQATVVKLNESELALISLSLADLERGHEAFAVTRGSRGCLVFAHGKCAEHGGFPVEAVDPVGAGDAFAAAFLHGLVANWPAEKIAEFANRAGAAAASRPGAI
jgi:fructokinase